MNKKDTNYILYLVTDKGLLRGRELSRCIEEAILGGVTLIQLREKDISTKDFYEEALRIKEITIKYNVPLIINDRLDIALAVDADGLHIGQQDMPLKLARKLMGEDKIIGVSASNIIEALKAEEEGADYLGVGAVFATATKDDAKNTPLSVVKAIKESVKIPVVAIGGINETNVRCVMDTGIDGVSVVSAILAKDDVKLASQRLLELISG